MIVVGLIDVGNDFHGMLLVFSARYSVPESGKKENRIQPLNF